LKNRYGKPFVAPSEQYEQYEATALWYIPKRGTPIDFPVNIKCTFYMPNHRPCDLTNHLESIDDVMVKAGLLKDDNYKILASHDGSRVQVDKQSPRTEVEISRI
jgi:Holliday junction resolvase RusA-like endonuclease